MEIRQWRRQAWEILWEPVFSRVSSFVELATALYSVARRTPEGELVLPGAAPQKIRGSIPLLSNAAEDSLQQFLAAALEYLSSLPRSSMEVPAKLIKAMKEVKQTVRIEEPALSSRQQALLRFYLLQIARVAGENG